MAAHIFSTLYRLLLHIVCSWNVHKIQFVAVIFTFIQLILAQQKSLRVHVLLKCAQLLNRLLSFLHSNKICSKGPRFSEQTHWNTFRLEVGKYCLWLLTCNGTHHRNNNFTAYSNMIAKYHLLFDSCSFLHQISSSSPHRNLVLGC